MYGFFLLVGLCIVPTQGVVNGQTSSFSFGAVGDIGASADATAVLKAIGANGLSMFFVLGDMSYGDMKPESAWCDYVKTHIGSTTFPFELIAGNHEDDTPAGYNINNFATCLPHRLGNIQGTYAKEYYTDYPRSSPLARFIMISPDLTLDGTKYSYAKGSSRYNWLSTAIDDARSRGIAWIVVGMHENCITMGNKSCSIGIDLFNLLVEKRVELILQAHDHNYQRSKQFALGSSCPVLKTGTYSSSCVADDGSDGVYPKGAGSVLVIAGTGGKGLYDVSTSDSEAGYFAKWMGANSNPRKGFVKFTVSASQLSAQFIGATSGTFTDSFTIQASGNVPTATPLPTTLLSPTSGFCLQKSQGDADCNGVINLIDFEQWRKEYMGTVTSKSADFNHSGAVDVTDFEIWRKGYFAATGPPSPSASTSPSHATSPTPTHTAGSDPSFACLNRSGPLQVVTGTHTQGKFEPPVAANKKFDARTASFEIPADISWGKIMLRGSSKAPDMCWAGGYVTASFSWHRLDISWDQSKHGLDGSGTYRNTTSGMAYDERMTWTGLHVFNVHDGIRTSNSYNNWTLQHLWLDYIRDDCVENDHIYSGTIYDSLFDGCYVGISTRPSDTRSSAGQTITIDRLLLRMEPMPYPYKWESKSDPVLTVPGYTIPGTNNPVPFGFGNVFKMEAGNEPNFRVTNSVFLLEYNSKKDLFPPKNKVTACSNNTIIWLGKASEAPTYLLTDFPGCFTIVTDKTQGKALWKNLVTDWHARHPGVGAHRKPASPGDYAWPRY